ncbi:metallophosphoesterase family protein [Nocardioides anomalus]|uniref:Metallophosphoesterase family protein n=1 Tax=Nocardioides anomalus TaxID=2712223 RepID=A0A6G6WHI5_9ACTN|nr:metallophosphoesterase [Nocardioides anomalus]QIG44555.1 metallophosphoesterase family protein [Nocardioides anomalus]
MRPGVRRGVRRRLLVGTAYVLTWVVLTVVCAGALFLHSSRETTLASHDAVLRPDLSGHVVLLTGPVLPDVRVPTDSRFGVEITLGKTDAASTADLVDRYALIASQPEGPQARVQEVLADLAIESVVRGGALALLPIVLWLLVGPRRRHALVDRPRSRRRTVALLALVALVGVVALQPWEDDEDTLDREEGWESLARFLGPDVPIPTELQRVEVRGDVTTSQTRRLVESAVGTYRNGETFYREAAEAAADLDLRRPEDGESLVLLVSDRHDNIGMDRVARAVGDAAGAQAVFDAGDDTSTGSTWEAFSLDSLDAAFDDGPYADVKWAVTGNHDHGTFVGRYLADHGWTVLDGDVVDGPAGVRLLGVGDPRSSGLGSWRDESGLTFDEVADRIADAACAAEADGERIGTVLVHDANMGDETLARGCADLVLGGHLHVQGGPTEVTGANGAVGYSYTTGTTGGAAYAIAVGAAVRRPAGISLVTYRDGRPVGVQAVTLGTTGDFTVDPYVVLAPTGPSEE